MALIDLLAPALGGRNDQLGALKKRLAHALPHKRLARQLDGNHELRGMQHFLGGRELGADILLGHLQRLRRLLVHLVPLVVVTQVLSELIGRKAKLLGETVCTGPESNSFSLVVIRLSARLLPAGTPRNCSSRAKIYNNFNPYLISIKLSSFYYSN